MVKSGNGGGGEMIYELINYKVGQKGEGVGIEKTRKKKKSDPRKKKSDPRH